MKTARFFLLVNGIFSGISGIALIFFSEYVSEFINQPDSQVTLFALGFALFGFGVLVLSLSKKKSLKPKMVVVISFLDFLWVLGSAYLLIYQPISFTSNGLLLIGVVAIIVLFFAFGQLIGLAEPDSKS